MSRFCIIIAVSILFTLGSTFLMGADALSNEPKASPTTSVKLLVAQLSGDDEGKLTQLLMHYIASLKYIQAGLLPERDSERLSAIENETGFRESVSAYLNESGYDLLLLGEIQRAGYGVRAAIRLFPAEIDSEAQIEFPFRVISIPLIPSKYYVSPNLAVWLYRAATHKFTRKQSPLQWSTLVQLSVGYTLQLDLCAPLGGAEMQILLTRELNWPLQKLCSSPILPDSGRLLGLAIAELSPQKQPERWAIVASRLAAITYQLALREDRPDMFPTIDRLLRGIASSIDEPQLKSKYIYIHGLFLQSFANNLNNQDYMKRAMSKMTIDNCPYRQEESGSIICEIGSTNLRISEAISNGDLAGIESDLRQFAELREKLSTSNASPIHKFLADVGYVMAILQFNEDAELSPSIRDLEHILPPWLGSVGHPNPKAIDAQLRGLIDRIGSGL